MTGADGNLWVTESGGHGAILRVTTAGAVTRFAMGLPDGADPRGIAAGADGNLYVAAYGANALARVGLDGTDHDDPAQRGRRAAQRRGLHGRLDLVHRLRRRPGRPPDR